MHKDFYRIRPDFEDIHLKLEKANILFHLFAACHHINKVWNNIDDWWEDEKVKNKKIVEKLTCKNLSEKETTKNGLNTLKNFQNDKVKNKVL